MKATINRHICLNNTWNPQQCFTAKGFQQPVAAPREKIGPPLAAKEASTEYEIIVCNEKLGCDEPAATLKKLAEALQKEKKVNEEDKNQHPQ